MDIEIHPWSDGDLPLLEQLIGDPVMMEHLGGPETKKQIYHRHQRYLQLPETDHMFKIVLASASESVGSIGYWEKQWRDQPIFETGWSILPSFQGRGVATSAGELVIAHARMKNRYRFLHAFPSVENPASNAICRKLGFTLLEACDFEYPPGHTLRCNDWRFDLLGEVL